MHKVNFVNCDLRAYAFNHEETRGTKKNKDKEKEKEREKEKEKKEKMKGRKREKEEEERKREHETRKGSSKCIYLREEFKESDGKCKAGLMYTSV